jgi:nickel-dependent lactate racemase
VRVDIPFDDRIRSLDLPDCDLTAAPRVRGTTVTRALQLDAEPIRVALESAQRLLVVVNDGYRPTPSAEILPHLKGVLELVPQRRVVVATGTHPAPSPDALSQLLGPTVGAEAVVVHDADEPGVRFGPLSDGSMLELNPLVEWADRVLLIGSVEPHFFAGFTGGAKQLLPGLATRTAIEANHRHAVSLACRPMRVAGNPVAEAIREASARLGTRLVSLQLVAGPDAWEAFCGGEEETFAQATRRCREVAGVRWPHPLDVLVAVVEPPLDRNLYQLQKAFENHQWAVRDGGALLLISGCPEGVGNRFFEPLARRYPDWRNLPPWETQTYSLGLHKLYRTAHTKRRVRLYLHSSQPPDLVRRFYFEPVTDLEAWLQEHIAAPTRVGLVFDATARVSADDQDNSTE